MTLHLSRPHPRSTVGADPARQALLRLRTAFAVAPIVCGPDEFTGPLAGAVAPARLAAVQAPAPHVDRTTA
jgi:hypothetical protein